MKLTSAKFRFSRIRCSAFMYVLKHLSYEEENKLKFSLALYIRLGFKKYYVIGKQINVFSGK